MAAKATIRINLKQSKRPKQAWDFTINLPGNQPLVESRGRYADEHSALRGALRQLGAWQGSNVGPHTAVVKGKQYPVTISTEFHRKHIARP